MSTEAQSIFSKTPRETEMVVGKEVKIQSRDRNRNDRDLN
jgi:hypothetical protein